MDGAAADGAARGSVSEMDSPPHAQTRLTVPPHEQSKEALMEEFKQIYRKKGAHDFQSQIKYLSGLADYYHQKGAEESDWVSLIKAHSLYNSVAARDSKEEEMWSVKAFEVQRTYWKNRVQISVEKQRKITECVRKELAEVRSTTQTRLDFVKDNCVCFNSDFDQVLSQHNVDLREKFMEQMENISQYCNDEMLKVFNSVVTKAIDIIGKPPCSLDVVAMGSIARGEATPYSDLEFLFLVERKSPKTVGYFEDLAMTVYFIIGCQQETKLKYIAIEELSGWFEDVSANGIKIDGLQKWAGNIPTGNGSIEQHNHFICTVDELVSRYRKVYDEPDPKESLRGDLTAMLSRTALIHGDSNVLCTFTSAIQKLKPNPMRKEASEKMLAADIKKYDFYPDTSLGETRDLKSDIYRYPSMLVMDLQILHRIDGSTAEVIKELVHRGIISPSLADCLLFTFCCALYLRLSTYLFHKSQNESMSVLSSNPDCVDKKSQWHVDRSFFVYMMIHLMPLKQCSYADKLKDEVHITETDCALSASTVSLCCGDYQTCYNQLKKLYSHAQVPDVRITKILAWSALELELYGKADIITSKAIENLQKEHKQNDHTDMASFLYVMGVVKMRQGQYEEAQRLYEQSLEMERRLYGDVDHQCIANSLSILGDVHECLSQYEEAENLYTQSLKMRRRLFGDVDHSAIADLFSKIGAVHQRLSQYEKAEKLHTESLEMRQRLYGDVDHSVIIASLNNLGVLSKQLGQYEKAQRLYTRSLEMRRRLYGDVDHSSIADFLNNLGSVHESLGQYERAASLYTQSLEMRRRLYGDVDHSDIAGSLYNLGALHNSLGQYGRAESLYNQSLEMSQRLYGDVDHSDLANSLNSLGNIHTTLGRYEKAESLYTQSLEMRQRLYGDADHRDIADSLNNLGSVHESLSQYERAEKLHTECLEMRQRLYGGADHFDVAASFNNLGVLHMSQCQYERAASLYTQSLEMRRRLYGDVDHSDIAGSLYNLGVLHRNLGQYERAESVYTQSLEMRWRLYGEIDHRYIFLTLRNLGDVYNHLKQDEKAASFNNRASEMWRRLQ